MSAIGAMFVTACDAVLLQSSKSYFTGGFLSVDHLESALDFALFFGASLIVDTAFIGIVAATVAWGLRRRLAQPARVFAGTIAAVSVLLAADFISYGLLRYLGDMFDVALMFDLTGRSVPEMLAVSGDHLVAPLVAIGGVVIACAGLAYTANRYWRGASHSAFPASFLLAPLVLGVVGGAVLSAASTGSDQLENGLLRKPAAQAFAAVINRVTDVDNDGFGLVGRMADPNPWDDAIFPYAVEVPGNGVDENGVGGDLPPDARHQEPSFAAATWQRRPDVLLFVLESFRADLLQARQNGVPVTPAINAIASRGISLGRAFSHNGYTVQSRYHLFTGSLLVRPTDSTIVDDFLRNGYVVGYISGQDESFGGARYDVGFGRATMAVDARHDRRRRYTTSTTPGSLAVPADVVQERVGDVLRQHAPRDAPLFLYVNLHDTHFPYWHDGITTLTSDQRLPRARIAPDARESLWRTYANTAANVDRAVGEIVAAVTRARGREPGVVITADHGESLYDEGFLGHGYALNDVQTRIPLVIANLPMTVSESFAQIDLRGALSEAFQQPGPTTGMPRVIPDPEREIFQYLGELARPRQIGFVMREGRLIYDFRSSRVQLPDGSWHRSTQLPEVWHREFLRLVWRWEAIRLASVERRGNRPEVE